MAWLRIDDGMAEHRKLLELKRTERWTWVELLCYVARQNNCGHVPPGIDGVLKYVTPAILNRYHEVGLLDIDDSGYVVHDWEHYNPKDPTAAERQRRHRNRDNGVTDA